VKQDPLEWWCTSFPNSVGATSRF